MIAVTFAAYFFVSFFVTVPFVVRYLIVSRRERKRQAGEFAAFDHAEEPEHLFSA